MKISEPIVVRELGMIELAHIKGGFVVTQEVARAIFEEHYRLGRVLTQDEADAVAQSVFERN